MAMKWVTGITGLVVVTTVLTVMAFPSFAGEKQQAAFTNKGEMNYKDLWTEQEVKNFLQLPYSSEPTTVSRISLEKFHTLSGIARFANIFPGGEMILTANENSLGGVWFKLGDRNWRIFSITIYSPTSCRNFCDSIFRYVTGSVALWSKIPSVYEPRLDNGIYTLRTKGARLGEMYFDLKRLYVIQVCEDGTPAYDRKTDDKQKTLSAIAEIIGGIVDFIENDKYKPTRSKAEYNEILKKYRKVAPDSSPICREGDISLPASDSKLPTKEKNGFFHSLNDSEFEDIRAYAEIRTEGNVIPAADYQPIVNESIWWITKILKPEFIPDRTFMARNIMLVPHNRNKTAKDLTVLSYKMGQRHFMIVQSGGINARIWIFIADPESEYLKGRDKTNIPATFFRYINQKFRSRIPPMITKETGNGYISTAEPVPNGRNYIDACFYAGNKELCLVLRKESPEDTIPARVPMPEQWFSWWKKQ
ncbi:MAG: hypothetical protein PHQ27_05755 [Victivallales bacterium]|nr:hypothetical protein [Victivallales bacterium]